MIGREVPGFGRCWELTAPESYALLHGPKREHGTQAFKLALIELIARKKISLVEEEKRGFFGRKGITLLAPGEDRQHPESRSLAALLDLLDATGGRVLPDGRMASVPVAKLVRAAGKKYGWPGGYSEAEVMPALAARGLYERRERRIPVPFGRPQWEQTPSGRRAMEKLEEVVSLGYRRFDEWVAEDPEQALKFLEFAGSATLTMKPLHRYIRRLSSRRESASDPSLPVFSASFYPDLEIFDGLDAVFPVIDFGLTGGDVGGDGGGGA